MRRAFTLIEVVLSLALLGTLAVAAVSWTTGSLRVQRRTLTTVEQARQAETLERLVRADLFNLDLALAATQRREERVWSSEGTLHVLTRDRGAAEVSYRFDPDRRVIVRARRSLENDGASTEAVIATGIASCSISITRDRSDERWSMLTISVDLAEDKVDMAIQISLPAEWTP